MKSMVVWVWWRSGGPEWREIDVYTKNMKIREWETLHAIPAIAIAALLVSTHRKPSTSLLLSLFSATVIL